MRTIVLFFLISGILSGCNNETTKESNNKLQIVTTIKPIQSLIVAIAGDLVESHQLIPDGASPHSYSFKPSDIRRIKKADIIFRIDEHFETYLNKSLKLKKADTQLISLADQEEINLLEVVKKHQNNQSTGQHQHGNTDLHIWTSPKNIMIMAAAISKSLTKSDPKNGKKYQVNLTLFNQEVSTASSKISDQLNLLKEKPYIVFHNSWQYFANYFGMREPHIISLQHDISSSAKSIANIRNTITTNEIQCVFSEPGIRNAQLNAIIENLDVKTQQIDTLQSKQAVNKNTYVDWLIDMQVKINTCLQ